MMQDKTIVVSTILMSVILSSGCSKSADLSQINSCRSTALQGIGSSSVIVDIEDVDFGSTVDFEVTNADIEELNSQGVIVKLVMGYSSEEEVKYSLKSPSSGRPISDTDECFGYDNYAFIDVDNCTARSGQTRYIRGANSLLGITSEIKTVSFGDALSADPNDLIGDWSLETTSEFGAEFGSVCYAGLVLTSDGSGPLMPTDRGERDADEEDPVIEAQEGIQTQNLVEGPAHDPRSERFVFDLDETLKIYYGPDSDELWLGDPRQSTFRENGVVDSAIKLSFKSGELRPGYYTLGDDVKIQYYLREYGQKPYDLFPEGLEPFDGHTSSIILSMNMDTNQVNVHFLDVLLIRTTHDGVDIINFNGQVSGLYGFVDADE